MSRSIKRRSELPPLRYLLCFIVIGVAQSLAGGAALADDGAPKIGMLYWVGGNQLSRAATDGTAYEVLVSGLDAPDGLTLDLINNVVYWTNMSRGPNGSLQRARLDGSPVVEGEKHLVAPASFETGKEVEFDPVENKLYWADRDGKHIMRSNSDGSQLESVLHKFVDNGKVISLENPVGIALDPVERHVYITDRFMGKIMRFNMAVPAGENHDSRSDVAILIEPGSDEERPIDIDLDLENQRMYWTDRGVHQVLRAGLDGSGREVLVNQSMIAIEDPIGMSLDLAQGKIYWSDMTTHKIHRANLDGSGVEEIIGGERILNGVPYGPLGLQYRALQPEAGPTAGGGTVAVLGSNFVAGKTSVRLGAGQKIPARVISANLLTFATPPGKRGAVSLSVMTPHGETILENAYHYR